MRLIIALVLIGLMATPSLARERGRGGGWHGPHGGGWSQPWRPRHSDSRFLGGLIGGILGGALWREWAQPVQNWCIEPDGHRYPC